MADLLYEIGTEEIPAGYLAPALRDLAEGVRERLIAQRLGPDRLLTAGTPRRMALFVTGIPPQQPPLRTRSVGPPAGAAYDEGGNPTPAAEGFARAQGVEVGELEVQQTEKGPYVTAVREEPGAEAACILPELLGEATLEVGFPKVMRWEPGGAQFARPIRWLVALLDERVLPVEIAGVRAGRASRGHRFLSDGPPPLQRADWEAYTEALREHFVIADIEERREVIREQVNGILSRHGSELRDEDLLDEVTNMVEWPHAVEGAFGEQFLEMPAALLTAAMKRHQRYFPVRDAGGELTNHFVIVANSTAEHERRVREGNRRVLRARLEDAEFYWRQDSRRPLEELVPRLAEVVFLGELGDNLQRTERLRELASRIAAAAEVDICVDHVHRAAYLCKADLLTGLVAEFPALQGVVGRELARRQGEPEPVARAIAEHYLPAGAGDELPETLVGSALALADKLDVIVGCFSLGLLPSGSQDPYALRRNALGVLLICEEKGLGLRLDELLQMARAVAREQGIACDEETADQVMEFFRDRLYHAAIDRGRPHDFVRAVLAASYSDVADFWRRLEGLAECARQEWWPRLVELVDRTYRIQRDAEGVETVREELLEEPLEKELAAALKENAQAVEEMFERGEYVPAARRYCSDFARLVHDFFEEVFVNVEDERVRRNRKALCARVYHLFAHRFADLYLIETAEG